MRQDNTLQWMWPEACAMLERAERLHRQFHHLSPLDNRSVSWVPPIDVLETEAQVFVLVGLPGVDPDTVEAVIDGNQLVIAGDRSLPDEIGLAIIHRLELPPRALRTPDRFAGRTLQHRATRVRPWLSGRHAR